MRPKRIILVRHGESQANVEPSHYEMTPDYAFDLTEQGREQARQAGESIAEIIGSESLRAYISPWYRTRQTYDEIKSKLGNQIVKACEDPRIREQEWGHFQSIDAMKVAEQERIKYSTFYYRLPDGESGADVFDRVSTFFETLHRDFAKSDFPDNALIVTHGMTLRIFLMRWFHWSVEYFERVINPNNAEVVVMDLGDNGRYALVTPLRLREDKKREKLEG